ncbi:MAG: hypothetical protein H7Z41_11900 [Cytophagales bacterium]|nr:hypothetical protein [Armatimonadota bacterium]
MTLLTKLTPATRRSAHGFAVAVSLCAVSLALFTTATAAPTAASPKAAFTVSRANLANVVTFNVTQTTAPKGSAPLIRSYRVSVKGNKARVEFEDPAIGPARYIANEKGVFLYIEGSGAASKYNVKGGVDAALRQAYQFVTAQGASYKKVGTATVSGQPTDVFKNVKNGASLYVGKAAGFRLPIKSVLTNEGGTQSFLVSNIKLNASIPDAIFALPAGTQIIDGASGGAIGLGGGKGG